MKMLEYVENGSEFMTTMRCYACNWLLRPNNNVSKCSVAGPGALMTWCTCLPLSLDIQKSLERSLSDPGIRQCELQEVASGGNVLSYDLSSL